MLVPRQPMQFFVHEYPVETGTPPFVIAWSL